MNKNTMHHHRNLRIGGGGLGHLDSASLAAIKTGPYEGKIAGLYDLEETLGRGHFAVVKLARHVFTGEKVAVKVIDKSKLDEVSKAHLFQEVRCMKLVQHPHVVRLYEVIDTATKLYLILELGDGGDLYDYIMRHDTGLSEQLAKEYFRQIVKAISYCHQLHVVHRDLKPENVVFFEKLGVVKLTDFGFSNKFCPGQKLETSCGSLAYSAPEILLGDSYDAPAVDVWSLGVILYMLVCGQPPFQEANDSETLTMIMDCKYNVPAHISKECRDLISRMLVKSPEKRATLAEISNHPWLAVGKEETPTFDALPLVSREQLSEEDHNLIVQKIVNGKIATKEEIQECLDKNAYNHITATYFLLAERKLRSKRQDVVTKTKRPDNLPIVPSPKRDNGVVPVPSLLAVPRTPGDVPQRSRKCSIVQEDEEEEEDACAGRDELVPPLNRRGSRSEGRLNLALQDRLTEMERRKVSVGNNNEVTKNVCGKQSNDLKIRMAKSGIVSAELKPVTTTIITDSSTISIPIITMCAASATSVPKYKTMPLSPTRSDTMGLGTGGSGGVNSPLQLVEIFEEGGDGIDLPSRTSSRQYVSRNQSRTSYEQRRSKFHKARTASCSSSDASDDDSEKRKKRAHKLNNTATATPSGKPFQGRRDSHDDSSDSQEPGGGAAAGGNNSLNVATLSTQSTNSNGDQQQQHSHKNTNSGNERKNTTNHTASNLMVRRHKNSAKRRSRETRLRESQSLNRITEVQEDGGGAHAALVIATTVVATQGAVQANNNNKKSIGTKLLQTLTMKRNDCKKSVDSHVSRKDTVKGDFDTLDGDRSTLKKVRLLGRYFQIHKKLLPFGGNKSRLYKAQSCGSLARDKISVNVLKCKQQERATSVMRNNSDGDINQNDNVATLRDRNDRLCDRKSATVVQLNNVCNELTGICAVHLGQAASKCCSFC